MSEKSGENNAHNPRAKIWVKFILILFLFGVIAGCGIKMFLDYRRQNPSPRKLTWKEKLAPGDQTTAPVKDIGPLKKEYIDLPTSLMEANNRDKFEIRSLCQRQMIVKSDDPKIPGRIKIKVINSSIICPADIKGPLRMKIYKGQGPSGRYHQVYDRTVEMTPFWSGRHGVVLPTRFDNAPEQVKQKYLQKRRADLQRKRAGRLDNDKKSIARFTYLEKNSFDPKDIKVEYFRFFLCDRDGRFIKEGKPLRLNDGAGLQAEARSRRDSERRKDRDVLLHARPTELQWIAMFPYFYGKSRWLEIWSQKPQCVSITGLTIDSIAYPPVVSQESSSRGKIGGKNNTPIWCSRLSLAYPFGGTVELRFTYKTRDGKLKKDEFKFYLPPSPPALNLKVDKAAKSVEIKWDSLASEINSSDYLTMPQLQLMKNNRLLKLFKPGVENIYRDKDVFLNEPLTYKMRLTGGECRTTRWTSASGPEKIKLKINFLDNPFAEKGEYTIINGKGAKPHPVRVELLKSSICYENTGETVCRALEAIIKTVNAQQDMVVYDRQSRDYIIDEKYFALTDDLKKQFLMSEADYAIQLKDFSRQDGNGVEVWLLKKVIDGVRGRKDTEYWRVGEVKVGYDIRSMAGIVENLIAKIRATLDFETCHDLRKKSIKPANVICPVFLPVNEKSVILNYEAICESLFLALGDQNDNVKIISRADWDQVFRERIARFDMGHSIIDKMVREVLLIGRMWRHGSGKSYYIQACDAFTGEVLDSRIISGKIQDVSRQMAEWISRLRLSDNIKADFKFSQFYEGYVKRILMQPWRIKTSFLKNYGPSIWRHQPWYFRANLAKRTPGEIRKNESFHAFVRRQWNDGFRARAIEMLEDEWAKSKKTLTGYMLSQYYGVTGNAKGALQLYDILLQRDDCPDVVAQNYNIVKKKAAKQVGKPVSSSLLLVPVVTPKILEPALPELLKLYKGYFDGQSRSRSEGSPMGKAEMDKYLNKYYFIDRNQVYAEWAPNQPCRTGMLALSVPWNELRQDLENGYFRSFGMIDKSYHRAAKNNSLSGYLLNKWYLPKKSDVTQSLTPQNIFLVAGWNSINPLAESINGDISFTKLGYFFPFYPCSSKIGCLYDHSILRGIMELLRHPDMAMPKYSYYDRATKGYIVTVTVAEDILRYYANMALTTYKHMLSNRHGLDVSQFKLHELLCLEYFAQKNEAGLSDLFKKIIAIKLPESREQYRRSRFGEAFVIFMAYRKDPAAIKLCGELDCERDKAHEYAYLLAKAGLNKEAGAMIRGAYFSVNADAASIRWAPVRFLNYFLENYYLRCDSDMYRYLLFGVRNDRAARNLFMENWNNEGINQYFGCPPAVAYQKWREEHLKKLEDLKINAKVKLQ